MERLRRFLAITGLVFSLLAAIAAGRVVATDASDLWYAPALIACGAASMFFHAWRLGRRRDTDNSDN